MRRVESLLSTSGIFTRVGAEGRGTFGITATGTQGTVCAMTLIVFHKRDDSGNNTNISIRGFTT